MLLAQQVKESLDNCACVRYTTDNVLLNAEKEMFMKRTIKPLVLLGISVMLAGLLLACENTPEATTSAATPAVTTVLEATTPAVTAKPVQPPCDHSYSDWTVVREATCAATGKEERQCSLCQKTEQRFIARLEHTVTYVEGVEPTCSSTGLTQSSYCTVCETVVSKAKEIAKLPHTFENMFCTVCGANCESEGLKFTVSSGKCYVSGMGTCTDTVVYIPAEYNGQKVYGVSASAFRGRKTITKVVFQSGQTTIGDYAFYGCTSLEEIVLPDTLESIGECAFEDCMPLKTIDLPDSLLRIGSWAFADSGITEISIPASVTALTSAFASSGIQTVIFEEGLEMLPPSTFYQTKTVKKVVFPKSLKIIGESAFEKCEGIESLTIPDSIIEIQSKAFKNCSCIQGELDLSDVQKIGEEAFSRTPITKVTLGGAELGLCVFQNCDRLKSAILVEGTTTLIAGTFNYCTALTSINIPSTVKYFQNSCLSSCDRLYIDQFTFTSDMIIEDNALTGINFGTLTVQTNPKELEFFQVKITHLILAEGVTAIGSNAFMHAKIQKISLPTTLEQIGESAFYGVAIDEIEVRSAATLTYRSFNNSKVKTLILHEGVTVENNAFNNTHELTTIYYKGTEEQWSAIYEDYVSKNDLKKVTVICSDTQ